MLRNRVIPILLMRDGDLVKTVKFAQPRYVGDPLNAIRILNEKEVDELVLLDIAATAGGGGPNLEMVRDVASECFMPLAYGGGISSVGQASSLFSIGVEKVVLRSAAARDLGLVREVSGFAGAQSVAISVDVQRSRFGRYRIYAPGTPLDRDPDWRGFVHRATDAGAGEVVLQSVDRDGTRAGLDLTLIREASRGLTVPLVAVGGVGELQDIKAGVDAGASAIGAGSFFVFRGPRRAVLITYPDYDDLTALLGVARPGEVQPPTSWAD